MEEILGCPATDTIVRQPDFLPGDINTLQPILERIYGSHVGRGLAVRIGRACFKHLLQAFSPGLGLNSSVFRLLPWRSKLSKGSEIITGMLEDFTHQQVEMKSADQAITWKITSSARNILPESADPIGMIVVGMLQEAFSWMSAGRYFSLDERCDLVDDQAVCKITVDLDPLE